LVFHRTTDCNLRRQKFSNANARANLRAMIVLVSNMNRIHKRGRRPTDDSFQRTVEFHLPQILFVIRADYFVSAAAMTNDRWKTKDLTEFFCTGWVKNSPA
jgi:hypothetical protein